MSYEVIENENKEKTIEKLKSDIKNLAENYSKELNEKISNRLEEMKSDDKSHYLIYSNYSAQ